MKRKIYSENLACLVKIGPKKFKVYEKTLNGYKYAYTEKKGYKAYKIGFIGLAASELVVSPR